MLDVDVVVLDECIKGLAVVEAGVVVGGVVLLISGMWVDDA